MFKGINKHCEESSRFTIVFLVVILCFAFLFIALFMDESVIVAVAVPAFSVIGVFGGVNGMSKTVEHSKWGKLNEKKPTTIEE